MRYATLLLSHSPQQVRYLHISENFDTVRYVFDTMNSLSLTHQSDDGGTHIPATRAPLVTRRNAARFPLDERDETVAAHARRTLARVRAHPVLAVRVPMTLGQTPRASSFCRERVQRALVHIFNGNLRAYHI